ncbi:MAG: pyruvate synthase subunit beta [Proteobacteria bacterium]|nr:pyruvate synthase subunit beta [Pseudomonadota bacterium]MBU1388568.1 pyruvate synthase subunit beta [Pseudomonadota bacterium]MBU1541392.1 pyruvate synthase subunit beta [Pseudomonadota bacterium]MBU2431696.1 pyruvate synthase subunit beta [Pseudomonadota bacterium]MBU2480925.1 pyruvate synthase subunit beta [Pseudomonadota bacterium]
MNQKTSILNLTEDEWVNPGNRACAGCGLGIVYRTALKALGKNTILVVPPSCLTVLQGLYPIAATKLPCLNVVFASTGAAATGVRAAMRARKKDGVNVVAFAGDGGTGDIGIQALSGACERGDDILYICYDNEAYMNTGVQRSGTTPQGVVTTTTPIHGKSQVKKDIPAIVAAHHIPYLATASAAYPLDLYDKVKKAITKKGPKYIHVHTPCPSGWGFEPSQTVKIGKLAVKTGLFALYEMEDGDFKLTGPSLSALSKPRTPVKSYFDAQQRFASLDEEAIAQLQHQVDQTWAGYMG